MTSILSERKDEDVDVLRLLSDTQNLALGTAIGVGVQMTRRLRCTRTMTRQSYELNSLNITDSANATHSHSLNITHSYEQHSLKHSLKNDYTKNAINNSNQFHFSHSLQPILYWKNAVQQGLKFTIKPNIIYRGTAASCVNLGVLTGLHLKQGARFRKRLRAVRTDPCPQQKRLWQDFWVVQCLVRHVVSWNSS